METFEMLKTAFGNEALGWTQTYKWWKHFKDCRTSTDDDPRSGQPSVFKTDEIVPKLGEVICSHRRLTVHEVAEEISIMKTVCHEVLTQNLGMGCTVAKSVPRLLTDKQKQI
jgi:hypothetical protein